MKNADCNSGPYAPAILRFQIGFPATYPDLPPLVTFSTDIFHPLLVPLTTYTFTTGSSDTDTVSATDEERLPPGGFSLRHGFPHWFGRAARRSATNSANSSRNVSGSGPTAEAGGNTGREDGDVSSSVKSSVGLSTGETSAPLSTTSMSPTTHSSLSSPGIPTSVSPRKNVTVVDLLLYIRSTLDDESVLDSLPLEAAGNPGAWHAWRTHRRNMGIGLTLSPVPQEKVEGFRDASPQPDAPSAPRKASAQTRLPGEWNWEGVWAKRVKTGIDSSFSDSVLFGNARGGSDDMVSLLHLNKLAISHTGALLELIALSMGINLLTLSRFAFLTWIKKDSRR